jgi:aminoglycoside phosphotransferase (APT) family kinase protein
MAEERLPLESLIALVEAAFRGQADAYGLRADAVQARYILNWGGFVNASFTVTDGQRSYHLKLADDPGVQEDLDRWLTLREHMEAHYHAPRVLDWVEIEGSGFAGLLFENIDGKPVDFSAQPEMLPEVLQLLHRLHNDAFLVERLRDGEDALPLCWEYFLDVYIDRFDEDLRVVAGNLPPFVSLDLLDWMMGETRELEGLARDLPAFQQPAASPTHGDLWTSNILVDTQGHWYVIDWDDLALGDPALEYSIVLGPFWRWQQMTQEQVEAMLPEDDALRARFGVCLRAFLLDHVIDSLADWVEAGFSPEHLDHVREEKQKIHAQTLALYQTVWPNRS